MGEHSPEIQIRPIVSPAELEACVAVQRRIWGREFAGITPATILQVAGRIGGVTAGAFDQRGSLLGFVFGMTGVRGGALVHWSHMLAVLPAARNHGIGRRLKEFQREAAAKLGAETIYWTFDPLVARNAHLNFNVLGVRALEYVRDMYGESTSPVHRGIGTDRLIVSWPAKERVLEAQRRRAAAGGAPAAIAGSRTEIPADIAAVQADDLDAARRWRERSRASFESLLGRGCVVRGFRIDGDVGHYYWSGPSEET